MNFLRLVPVILLVVGVHLCAMDNNQDEARFVYFAGWNNPELRMGQYFSTIHPEAYSWLLDLCFNRPTRSAKFGSFQLSYGLGASGSELFYCGVDERTANPYMAFFYKGVDAYKIGLPVKEKLRTMTSMIFEYDRDGNSNAVISTEGTHHFMEDRNSHCRMELPHLHLSIPPTWGINEESVACFSEYVRMIWIWDIQTIRRLHEAIASLSLAQQNFLISLFGINNQHHQPLVILPGTHAFATFETLSPCLQQLLLQNNCVQLNRSLMQQMWQAISSIF